MKIIIRPADLQRDRESLIATLSRYLTATSDEGRYDWLYRQNPYGPARAWLALDDNTGEVVGSSAAFVRRMMVDGREKTGWVLGDFCIADKCRSLGPALQLQTATLRAVGAPGEAEFCYDFPSRPMTALYKRSGISPAAQMVRWSKPLSLGGKFRQTGRMKSAARPAIWIGDLLLRLSDSRISWGNRWKVALQQGNCGDEFTALRRKLRTTSGIEVDRTAEYLNWRYLRHPSGEHQILTARESGELKGYLIFSCSGEKARIQEWGTENDAVLLPALVRALVRILRRTQIGNLNAFLLENDPRALILRKLGFWSRESSPVMLYWPETGAASAGDWLLMYGDRDI